MKEKDLRHWMAEEGVEDSWWVSLDGQLQETPLPLHKAFELPGFQPGCDLQVMHVSMAEEKEPPWVELDSRSALEDEKRKKFSLKKRKNLSRPLIQLAVVMVLFLVVVLVVPKADEEEVEQVIEDPMERVFAKMSEVRSLRASDPESTLPTLRISVATSGRILFISNLSDEVWPSCEVILNDPNGYRHYWEEPVDSLKTLHAPLRSFVRAGEPFNQETTPLRKVTVIVPGYRVWEDRFR